MKLFTIPLRSRLLMKLIIGILVMGYTSQVVAQHLAYTSPYQNKGSSAKETKLKSALLTLQQHYGVEILFEDRLVDPVSIHLRNIDFQRSFEKNLDQLLENTSLTFKKIRSNTYIISSKSNSPKQNRKTTLVTEMADVDTFQVALSVPSEQIDTELIIEKTVRGKVTDRTGEPLPGVNIVIQGTQIGTTTQTDGSYSLVVPDDNSMLIFSFVGYTTQYVTVGTQTSINITLEEDQKTLEEVVVVGYGTMKKSDLTGSVSTANLEAFKEAPNTNILQSIKGTIPGLQIGQTNQAGAEPSIQIRGRNTINGNQAVLIVLDGIIYNGRLGDINPADIESLSVLKDASSKAIYGAQAANGVILITTKSHNKTEKPTITYTTYLATQSPTSSMRLRNAEEKKQIIRDIYYKNAYLGPDYKEPNPNWDFNQTELVPENLKGIQDGVDYDWWGALTNPGFLTDHALTVSGNTEKTSYYLSGGFTKQKGFLLNDHYKRSSVRINLSTDITDWFTIGTTSFGSFTDYSGIYPNMGSMKLTSPFVTPKDENGEYIIYPTGATNIINPFLTAQADNKDTKNRFNGTFYGILKAPGVKGLEYRLNFNNNFITEHYFNANRYDANLTGAVTKVNQKRIDRTLDHILSYDRRFNDHGISATLVSGYRSNEFESTNASGTNVSNISLTYNSLEQATIQQINSDAWEETFQYQMARFNYNFKNTYIFTGTLRRDGYSGFSKNHKYGLFPSVGAAWVLTQTPFISIPKVDLIKLRASYGVNGNMTNRYSSLARVSTANESRYVFGGSGTAIGQSMASLANNNLRWERSKGLNIGLDFGMFNNRIGGNVDYYRTTTTDLLWNIVIPEITGFSSIASNIGEIRNNGLEVMFNATAVSTKNFEWDLALNFSTNQNKVITLLGEDKDGDGKEDDLPGSGLFIGKSIGTIYHYEIAGIWQLNDEIMAGYYPGAYRIVDQNNDGQITANHDRVFLGRTEPAYTFGVQSEMRYRGFTFRLFVNSIQGGKNGYLGANPPANVQSTGNFANLNTFNYDLWSVSNPNGKYAIGWSVPQINPTPYYSRTFVRLQDIALSYQLPKSVLEKISSQRAKIFVSGKNLFTLTKWDGWDPETGQGVHSDAYPVLKSVSAGVEFSF